MSIFNILKIGFLIIYFSVCAGIAYYIYKGEKQFYLPVYVTKKTGEGKNEEKKVLIHDEFDEFGRKDSPVVFWKLFLGAITLSIFKLISSMCFAISLSRKLYKILKKKEETKEKYTKEEIKENIEQTKTHASNFLRFSGIFHSKRRLPNEKIEPIYKKYFGPDYKVEYDGKFGCYICNHTSFNDILLGMAYYGCGFISKDAVKNYPIFGPIAQGLQSIFVERNNPNSRKEVLEKIVERQKDYIEGKPVMPVMIFPEGTTSSGRYLFKFKKGAFYSLMPLKPNIIFPNLNPNFHLGCGSTSVGINYGRTLTQLYVQTEMIELPIMTPNEYMFTNFSSYGKEKCEIYAEVAREIMCEIGGFKKTDKIFRDSQRYKYCIKNHVYVETEKFKAD